MGSTTHGNNHPWAQPFMGMTIHKNNTRMNYYVTVATKSSRPPASLGPTTYQASPAHPTCIRVSRPARPSPYYSDKSIAYRRVEPRLIRPVEHAWRASGRVALRIWRTQRAHAPVRDIHVHSQVMWRAHSYTVLT